MEGKTENKNDVVAVLDDFRGRMTARDRKDPGMAQVILGSFTLSWLTADELDTVAKFLGDELGLTRSEVGVKIKRARVIEALGCYPRDLEGYVDAYCRRYNVRPTLGNWVRVSPRAGTKLDMNGTRFDIMPAEKLAQYPEDSEVLAFHATLAPTIIDERRAVDRLKMFAEDFGLGFSESGIDRAWAEWVTSYRAQTLYWLGHKLGADLRGTDEESQIESEWDRFLAAILPEQSAAIADGGDNADQSPEVVRAVVSHFMWQVRRKICGLPLDHHMMPVFIGPQGGGKSEMVKRLLSPLAEVRAWVDSDFAKLTDDRNTELLGNIPVHFLDEMSYASKSDIEVTKRKISAEDVTYRPLYGNTQRTIRNIAVFVGCSNNELSHSVVDTTGNRRFFPIRVKARLDWNAVNSINWLLLWWSVDIAAQSPIKAIMDRVRGVQEANRTRSQVEEWLDARWSEMMTTDHAVKWSPAAKLYPLFRDFAQAAFRNPFELKDFRNEMRRLAESPNGRVQHAVWEGGNHVFRLVGADKAGGKPKLGLVQGGKP
ncbi:virulence-associated protein E [Azospirillum baldaniorum]|uniref:VapE domain-containing protein n=1 Tax=Azospirillum baldaniorum TaxID=1064539 RepID=UPI0011A25AB7|nr:VapE domain-containing protein [Azospirillum baldaniorum]TWA52124.1 virulence-associated protein E [Azospirillum baldaniorum]